MRRSKVKKRKKLPEKDLELFNIDEHSAYHGAVNENSIVVRRKIELVQFEIHQVEEAIVALESAVETQSQKLLRLQSRHSGLIQVLQARSAKL
jgi:hypothetical protein